MKVLIFALVFFPALESLSARIPRETTTGYLRVDSNGRTFFVKSPFALEPGLEVRFQSKKSEDLACKITNLKSPHQCPMQTISFEPVTKNRKVTLDKARVEHQTTSSWHRLRAAELRFKRSTPSPKK